MDEFGIFVVCWVEDVDDEGFLCGCGVFFDVVGKDFWRIDYFIGLVFLEVDCEENYIDESVCFGDD